MRTIAKAHQYVREVGASTMSTANSSEAFDRTKDIWQKCLEVS